MPGVIIKRFGIALWKAYGSLYEQRLNLNSIEAYPLYVLSIRFTRSYLTRVQR
ncbi:hypothetical protein PILCRDRAFT_816853 [Piloderma croceum F 1598]|uniref:Uncharacterized protein n=1 Tax=Piloderma croceum (strain F 1598) TaxID=765440 RepID=A0A0C3BH91_PILCF|nr:hypothetical protein PILCRDRAFT_816853 [Piloderma croceum F 1598]